MSFPSTGLILEVIPFISIIIVELATGGGEGKFKGEFKKQPVYNEISDNQATVNNIGYTALLSYHYEQSMRYFDIATIASFVIFLTKLFSEQESSKLIVIGGIISIVSIVTIRVWMRRYFESITATEYGRKDLLTYRGYTIRKGDIAIVVANLIPIFCLILIDIL